jgi:hypothetical protein
MAPLLRSADAVNAAASSKAAPDEPPSSDEPAIGNEHDDAWSFSGVVEIQSLVLT